MRNYLQNLVCLVTVCIFLISSCGRKTELKEYKSGRLNFVETLKFGSVGTHGSQGWYVNDRRFFVNGRSWKPVGINVDDTIGGCETTPNETVEALKCYGFSDLNETVFILRMENDKPDWQILSQQKYESGKNLGEWAGDGKYIIFKDLLYNIEKNERTEIKGLPDYPRDAFRGTSPDLEKIVYQGDCFYGGNVSVEVERRRNQTCDNFTDNRKKKIEVLWIIEAETGETKLLKSSVDKYDWLVWNQDKFRTKSDWLGYFNRQLVWEKDKDGKYQLVSTK